MSVSLLKPRAEKVMDGFALDPYCKLYLPLWKTDGDSFMSKDAYGHVCTRHADAHWTPQGWSFDGTGDCLSITHHDSLNITNNFTLELWLKTANLTQTQAYLLHKTTNIYSLIYEFVNNQIEFFAVGYTGDDPRTGSQIPITDIDLHHIVYSYNGNTWAGYKDLVQIFSLTKTFVLGTSSDALYIGAYSQIAHLFAGLLPLVLLYSRALTPQEIQKHSIVGKELFG